MFKGFYVTSTIARKIKLALRRQRHRDLLEQDAINRQFERNFLGSQHLPVRRSGRHALQRVLVNHVGIAKEILRPAKEVLAKKRDTLRKWFEANRAARSAKRQTPTNRQKKEMLMSAARAYGWRGQSYRAAQKFERRLQRGLVAVSGPQRGQRVRHSA